MHFSSSLQAGCHENMMLCHERYRLMTSLTVLMWPVVQRSSDSENNTCEHERAKWKMIQYNLVRTDTRKQPKAPQLPMIITLTTIIVWPDLYSGPQLTSNHNHVTRLHVTSLTKTQTRSNEYEKKFKSSLNWAMIILFFSLSFPLSFGGGKVS